MARKPMPWFRCYVEVLTDRKIRRLSPEHRWLWITVLGMARMSPVEGMLMVTEDIPAEVADIAEMAGVTSSSTVAGLKRMVTLGLLQREADRYIVPAWDARQYASDRSTERVRAHRERSRNADGTFQNRSSNGLSNHTESETESETESSSKSAEGETGSNPAVDDEDDRLRLIHNHLTRWAKGQGKRNPTGYAIATATNHRDELAGLDDAALTAFLDNRWPAGTTPPEPVDGKFFLPGTGVIPTGDREHDLSATARAALTEMESA
jgi:hypothetical protein